MVNNCNTNNNLHKLHHYHHKTQATNSTSSTSSQEGSASSPGIYLDDTDPIVIKITQSAVMDTIQQQDVMTKCMKTESISTDKSKDSKDCNHNNTHNHHLYVDRTRKKDCKYKDHNSSLFAHDYIKNFVLLSKLYSPQEYYSNIHGQISQSLPFISHKKQKYRGSDCPSDISSIDSRRRKSNKSKLKRSKCNRFISWIKYMNLTLWDICKFMFELIILWCNRFQKWQKELHEAPIEVKEKYFFIVSTIISTVLFYILFLCLDVMIKHWFALPSFITEYSFSISYCISYLTSVIWQHFFNQYFVFTMARSISHTHTQSTDTDAFCDSLLRTYLVYGCSLMITGIIGSMLQIYVGIADEFVLFLTLPISGVINYYLLRYCHNKQSEIQQQHEYQLLHHHHREREREREKPRHKQRDNLKYAKSASAINIYHNKNKQINIKHHHKHNHAIDDIIIV